MWPARPPVSASWHARHDPACCLSPVGQSVVLLDGCAAFGKSLAHSKTQSRVTLSFCQVLEDLWRPWSSQALQLDVRTLAVPRTKFQRSCDRKFSNLLFFLPWTEFGEKPNFYCVFAEKDELPGWSVFTDLIELEKGLEAIDQDCAVHTRSTTKAVSLLFDWPS